MSLNNRAVDQYVFKVCHATDFIEHSFEYPALSPTPKSSKYAVPVAEFPWQIPLGGSCPYAPQHSLQKQEIVFPCYAAVAFLAAQVRFLFYACSAMIDLVV